MDKKIWTDEGSWNVIQAEKDILHLERLVNIFSIGSEDIIKFYVGEDKSYREVVNKSISELRDILFNDGKEFGYHLNCIISGKTLFSLFDNNGKQYKWGNKFATKEEAEDYCSQFKDAYVDDMRDEDNSYVVWILDEDGTQSMREHGYGGEFVQDFDSKEEAEDEGKKYESYYIEESPDNEMWVIINNTTMKNEFNMFFPSAERALAFLYKKIKPEGFMNLINYEREGK